MLSLRPDSVMNLRKLDNELVDFLTAPISAQKMSPETWLRVWDHVCIENCELLKMQDTLYCILCNRPGILYDHLLSEGCKDKRKAHKVRPDPLLTEILRAASGGVE